MNVPVKQIFGVAKVQLVGAGALGLYGFLAMLIAIQLVCSG